MTEAEFNDFAAERVFTFERLVRQRWAWERLVHDPRVTDNQLIAAWNNGDPIKP